MATSNIGIIYKITNKVNNKIYIGKTKDKYGNSSFGIDRRFKQHIVNAYTKSKYNDCPKLYNAIRKYGRESFCVEELDRTTIDKYDDMEIEYIRQYNSMSDEVGYNIAAGGMGRSVVFISDETRNKISTSGKSPNQLLNIKPIYKKGIIIGYSVRRRLNGIQYSKMFTSTKNTNDVNLKLAKEWLYNLENDYPLGNKYNKKDLLPKNISSIKDENNKKIIGYRVDICKNGIKTSKSFQDKAIDLDTLMKNAIMFKNNMLK